MFIIYSNSGKIYSKGVGLVSDKGLHIHTLEDGTTFFGSEVVNDLNKFKEFTSYFGNLLYVIFTSILASLLYKILML